MINLFIVITPISASCRVNQTAMDNCGDGNTCFGSSLSYICVCEGPGWTLNPNNYRECIEGIICILM